MTSEHYYYGTGRRKTAVARVRLYPGQGPHTINDKPLEEVFTRVEHRHVILQPLEATDLQEKFHAQVKVAGGGISGWAAATALGIARALVVADESVRKPLRRNGLLTRDPREKERKKYGLKRARKAPQYTKR
ncbi:MAG: 30S ribosomal protein S9 [Chloroflexi bacterium RBG_16_68_14]|nr:MAG: 30S ribosomal protein S9 [Chloroflexi bacterium RBG_16_68_14]